MINASNEGICDTFEIKKNMTLSDMTDWLNIIFDDYGVCLLDF